MDPISFLRFTSYIHETMTGEEPRGQKEGEERRGTGQTLKQFKGFGNQSSHNNEHASSIIGSRFNSLFII